MSDGNITSGGLYQWLLLYIIEYHESEGDKEVSSTSQLQL